MGPAFFPTGDGKTRLGAGLAERAGLAEQDWAWLGMVTLDMSFLSWTLVVSGGAELLPILEPSVESGEQT